MKKCVIEGFLPDEVDRFWEKVSIGKEDDCWYWKSGQTTSRSGYGRMNLWSNGRVFLSNQLAYTFSKGLIPIGALVLHSKTCVINAERDFGDGRISRMCCNPNHLRLGTQKENVRDTKELGRMRGLFKCGHVSMFGEGHVHARLTKADVYSIRNDQRKQKVIASEYGIDPSHVSRIKSGQHRRAG